MKKGTSISVTISKIGLDELGFIIKRNRLYQLKYKLNFINLQRAYFNSHFY